MGTGLETGSCRFFGGNDMKVTTIALAAVFALSTTSMALAKHRHHHHHKHGMSMGSSGSSGPGMEAGAPDKSRPGGKGVSKKPAE